MSVKIQPLKKQEIQKVAQIASQCFGGMKEVRKAKKWILCNFLAFPRARYFAAKESGKILGYILWLEKGGFREKAVFELEQIGVAFEDRGRGLGTQLILESLSQIRAELKKRKATLKLIEVTTGTDNQAQRLYQKTLGAKPEATFKDFFRGDEVIMLARF